MRERAECERVAHRRTHVRGKFVNSTNDKYQRVLVNLKVEVCGTTRRSKERKGREGSAERYMFLFRYYGVRYLTYGKKNGAVTCEPTLKPSKRGGPPRGPVFGV